MNLLSKMLSPLRQRKIIGNSYLRKLLTSISSKLIFFGLIENSGAKAIKNPGQISLPLSSFWAVSTYLGDVLIRQGKDWAKFFLRQIKIEQKTVTEHLAELEPSIAGAKSLDDFSAALRRHKQREYLRIGARDLMPSVTLEETLRELTVLAEASLEAAYRYCRAEVETDFGKLLLPGKTASNGFVILGMGKLGGSELNFSSDIDVIFLFEDDEGESSGGRKGKPTPRNFFTAIAKKIIHAMGRGHRGRLCVSHRLAASPDGSQRSVGTVRRFLHDLL